MRSCRPFSLCSVSTPPSTLLSTARYGASSSWLRRVPRASGTSRDSVSRPYRRILSYRGLLAARFILGLFESIIFAGFGTIISAWWTKDEQPWRTAVIFSTLSSVVNGLLSYAASRYHGSLGQWQVLFLSVGAITFAWAILCWFFLAGSPLEAHWLSRREKVIAIQRVAGNMTGVQNKVVKPKQIVEAFIDPKSWLIFAINREQSAFSWPGSLLNPSSLPQCPEQWGKRSACQF